jgi:hypothetical protein
MAEYFPYQYFSKGKITMHYYEAGKRVSLRACIFTLEKLIALQVYRTFATYFINRKLIAVFTSVILWSIPELNSDYTVF